MGVTTRNGTVVGGLGASLLEASNAVGVGLVATADCDPGTGVAAREWIGVGGIVGWVASDCNPGTGVAAREWIGVGGIVGWVASDCNPGTGVAAREGIGVVSAEGASSQSKSN